MRPFLKWPGGKRWLISRYGHIFPKNYVRYFEPFLGGGSALFYLMPDQAIISDINSELINTYRMMAKFPAILRTQLKNHQKKHCYDYYYKIRDCVPVDPIKNAARFLYLNRTCFNGMYRVNQQGVFNVPIGTKNHFIDDVDCFEEYAKVLKNVKIRKQDFVQAIRNVNEGDFIFADPPYTIAHNQNSFIKYNEKLFSWNDQNRLLNALTRARDRGAVIVATNAFYHPLQEMYQENQFYTWPLNRFSSISGSADSRGMQKELLISSNPITVK